MLFCGGTLTLQKPKSEVIIEVPEVENAYLLQRNHAELSGIKKYIPEEETIIGPVVEVHLKDVNADADITTEREFKIRIPHCINSEEDKAAVNVRWGTGNEDTVLQKLSKGTDYNVEERHITIRTKQLGLFVTSVPSTAASLGHMMVFPFGSLRKINNTTFVNVRVFLCSHLMAIADFREVRIKINYYHKMHKKHVKLPKFCTKKTTMKDNQ